jgi:hypothetical protein
MKSLIVAALLATSAPALAAASPAGDRGDQAESQGDRRTCTRVERHSGSRLAYQRVCLSATEWRERLGTEWRRHMPGTARSDEGDPESLETRARRHETVAPFTPNP